MVKHPRLFSTVNSRFEAAVELLRPAEEFSHFSGSLFDHLIGTWQILTSLGYCEDVALAGLFHSVYSTEYYDRILFSIDKRSQLEEVIGDIAERWAFLFCTVRRVELWEGAGKNPRVAVSRLDGTQILLSKSDIHALLAIECANYMEQCSESDLSPRPYIAWYLQLARLGRVRISKFLLQSYANFDEKMEADSIEIINDFVKGEGIISGVELKRASILNPYSFELSLLSSLTNETMTEAAVYDSVRRSRRLIEGWGTSWDKRLTASDWLQLCNDILQARDQVARRELAHDIARRMSKNSLKWNG